jgi:serpin B
MRKAKISSNLFTFDIYREIKSTPGNLFCSPYCIFNALEMIYAGAGGETARKIAAVLHFDQLANPPHSELGALRKDIENGNSLTTQIEMADALWVGKYWHFLPGFLSLVRDYHIGEFRALNFSQSENARDEINRWVSKKTHNRINEILGPESIDKLTAMIITSAIYFKARWYHPFDIDSTHDATFYTLEDKKIPVPMMKQETSCTYSRGDTYQVIDLTYSGYDHNMLVILPDKDKFTEFENCLDSIKLNSILDDMKYTSDIRLSMPKFKFEPKYEMSNYLKSLGIKNAFEMNADFSGMTDTPGFFLNEVIHSTFISVDEYGTEAAAGLAARMVGGMPGLAEPTFIDVVIDRPFIFLITDFFSGTVLFIGRVLNPLM